MIALVHGPVGVAFELREEMRLKHLTIAFFIAATGPMSVLPAYAESGIAPIVEENAEQRINYSGKLRMLSQRIPSAACHLSQGIDVDGALDLLVGATAEFEKILAALEKGDTDLDIQSAETNRRTLQAIGTLRERWEPLKEAANALANATATKTQLDYIFNENLQVLSAAQLLVEQLVRQYSSPNAMTFSSLMLIDISGRQRMLTQKMSKETCMIESGYSSEQLLDDLASTMRIFENSLVALQNGMPEVGILPPPNEQIEVGLDGVSEDWARVRPYMSEILAGGALNEEAETQKFQGLNQTMANMNIVVGMYAGSAKVMVPLR